MPASIATLIDYLQDFPRDTRVVLTADDVQEPCEFVALDVALAQIADMEDAPAQSAGSASVDVRGALEEALPLLRLGIRWTLESRGPGAMLVLQQEEGGPEQRVSTERSDFEGFWSMLIEAAPYSTAAPEDDELPLQIAPPTSAHVNTKLSYLYRDAMNYKTSRTVVLPGVPSPALVAILLASLHEHGFIPGQVGLPDLQDSFEGCDSDWDDERDHPFHEVSAVEVTDRLPPPGAESFETVVRRMAAVRYVAGGWDEAYRPPFYETMVQRRRERTAATPAPGAAGG